MSVGTFELHEIGIATAGAAAFQTGFFILLALFAGTATIPAKEEVPIPPKPMKVKPVLDDAPLLKLGGKRVRAKLPDMWVKRAPVKRFEAKSAPSPEAEKTPEAIPTTEVAKGDAEAPPPDAEVAAQVDEDLKLIDASVDVQQPNIDEEGHADGVKEGTETDPLKARAVSQYRMRIIGWFNARFRPPVGQMPCDELKKTSAGVVATISPDGTVTGFSVTRASGNAAFDGKVNAAMQSASGQQIPPPPKNYPDVRPPSVSLHFTGASAKCE